MAFPGFSYTHGYGDQRRNEHSGDWETWAGGLTKREQFAMAAMQGLLGNTGVSGGIHVSDDKGGTKLVTIETAAVIAADNLLKELAKE